MTNKNPTIPHGDNFGAYKGLVEQRVDPERLGRMKVRVVGVHSKDIPINHLPWAWPRTPAWKEGGIFMIPPIGCYVWIDFEKGEYEYPVWDGGFWALDETAQGLENSAHRYLPMSWFGSDKPYPKGHILQLESWVEGVKPIDAPNNFAFVSPLNKRLELDDRKDRNRVVVADELDNYLYINTESGVVTLEASIGHRSQTPKHRGINLLSDVTNELEILQLYTFERWRVTIDDLEKYLDISAPSGAKFRITDDPENKIIETWTEKGHHMVFDDIKDLIKIQTRGKRGVLIDETKKNVTLFTADDELYMYLDEEKKIAEMRSSGDLNLKAVGNINASAIGMITLDGLAGVYFNSGFYQNTPTLPERVRDPVYEAPESPPQHPRAPDYTYYDGGTEIAVGSKPIV